ncbi:hypothetical protein MM809_29530, partial [Klebsiella pneumoniae]|nr:hypothetical protein [Klebsiella pneumoniae]
MHANKEPNWEKRLENLRQTRRMKAVPTYAPLSRPSETGTDAPVPKLDDESRARVLKAYLKNGMRNTMPPLPIAARKSKPTR